MLHRIRLLRQRTGKRFELRDVAERSRGAHEHQRAHALRSLHSQLLGDVSTTGGADDDRSTDAEDVHEIGDVGGHRPE